MNCIGERSCYDEGKRAAETLTFDYMREHGLEVRSRQQCPEVQHWPVLWCPYYTVRWPCTFLGTLGGRLSLPQMFHNSKHFCLIASPFRPHDVWCRILACIIFDARPFTDASHSLTPGLASVGTPPRVLACRFTAALMVTLATAP